MLLQLNIFNPSDYWRKGDVSISWDAVFQEIGVPPNDLVVKDHDGQPLRMQVDNLDPKDPTPASLTFRLEKEIGPSDNSSRFSTSVTLERGNSPKSKGPRIEAFPNGFKLINNCLEIWFNIKPEKADGGCAWFSGSASMVQLDGKEILDALRAELDWMGHDPEKRIMQIDRVLLPRPAWEETPSHRFQLYDQRYDLISSNEGALAATVTIASQPFDYKYLELSTKRTRSLQCRLYRSISLWADVSYITERIFVLGEFDGNADVKRVTLTFTPRFFTYIDMGLFPHVVHYHHIPDWIAIGFGQPPFQGYGFATNVHAGPVANPHPDYPKKTEDHRSFSWELGPSRYAYCLHLFTRSAIEELKSHIGRAWYELIYKPLYAAIPAQGAKHVGRIERRAN